MATMKRLQFSLATFLAVIVFVAFAMGALKSANELWDSAAFSVAILIFLFAIVAALFRKGDARVFWASFALFGWAYLVLVFAPGLETRIAPRLLTTKLLVYLQQTVLTPRAQLQGQMLGGVMSFDVKVWDPDQERSDDVAWSRPEEVTYFLRNGNLHRRVLLNPPTWPPTVTTTLPSATSHFLEVGHSLLSMLIALLGAIAARCVLRSRDAPPQPETRA